MQLSRDGLKIACETQGFSSTGRQKSLLISRLLGEEKTAATKKPAPSKTVKTISPTKQHKDAVFEQAFKNIDDILHKDAGCSSELDYTEQTSWMLFLKYLDGLEHEKSLEAELMGEKYQQIINAKHQWSAWAAPKDEEGNFDHSPAAI